MNSGQCRSSSGFLFAAPVLATLLAIGPDGFRCEGAPVYSVVKSFGNPDGMGTAPRATPIEGSDGVLYGTTFQGGVNKTGTIYRVNGDGTGYKVLRHFGTAPQSGAAGIPLFLYGRLLEARDGFLYGTGLSNGFSTGGAIFKIDKSGAGFRVIRSHPITGSQPREPVAGLIEGSDGALYGTTGGSGISFPSSVYKINTDGSGYAVLKTFNGSGGTPGYCATPLVEAGDGVLYGTTQDGGATHGGTIFKLNKDGSGFQVVRSFIDISTSGYRPSGGLIQGNDGAFYGATQYGGTGGGGVVYRINGDGSAYEVLRNFNASGPGELRYPIGELVEGPDGNLYGAAQQTGAAPGGVFRLAKNGSGYTKLAQFPATGVFGSTPNAGLLQKSDGLVYGVAHDPQDASRSGIIYRLTTTGENLTAIHSFSDAGGEPVRPSRIIEGADNWFYGTTRTFGFQEYFFKIQRTGATPTFLREYSEDHREDRPVRGDLFEANDGNFYSATSRGGTGFGTVTRVDRTGQNFVTLHSFTRTGPTGSTELSYPEAGVIEASDGLLYGTTSRGGSSDDGTVFQMARDGTGFRVLHSFVFEANQGGNPLTHLVEGSDGKLYGTTDTGFYRLNRDGTGYAFYPVFLVGGRSGFARDPLMEASDGVLYGTTFRGATNDQGTIYRVNRDGTGFATLFTFGVGVGAPRDPISALVQGADGSLYGITQSGGTRGSGVLFRINRDGTGFSAVHNFGAAGDGVYPIGLLRSRDNVLYGTTDYGGLFNYGTLFRFGETPEIGAPEIVIHDGRRAGGPKLVDGQAAAVDFGRNVQGTLNIRTFTIANIGTADLLVSSVTVPSGYEISGLPAFPLTVTTNQPLGFEVSFISLGGGTHAGSVTIASNDPDEALFDFPLTGEIFIPNPDSVVVSGSTVLNHQTGLREQTIHVSNDTTATVPAYDLIIRGLPAGVEVYNASATRADGSVVVQVRQMLGPHQAQDIVIEYYSADVDPAALNPQISTEVVLDPPNQSVPGGAEALLIDRVIALPGGNVLLGFTSVPASLYQIQYSSDGRFWKDSLTRMRAAGSRTQWIDRGPPRTDSPPGVAGSRLYRVKDAGL